MFALGEKTVNQRKHEIICTHAVDGQTRQCSSFVTSLNGIIEVQILEFTSRGLHGCNLKEKLEGSNGTKKATF